MPPETLWQRVLFHMIATLSCTQCSSFTWGWIYFWSISCGCLSTGQSRTTGGRRLRDMPCFFCSVGVDQENLLKETPGLTNLEYSQDCQQTKQVDNPEWIRRQDCQDQQNLIKGHVPPRYFLWFPKLCILAKSWIILHQPVVVAVVLHQPVAVVLDLKTPD